MKLNCAIANLSKLRHNTNLDVLKIIYHSFFRSHLLYGSQVLRQKGLKTQAAFQTLQNRDLKKKIIFENRRDSATCIYKNVKVLKHRDRLTQEKYLFCSHPSKTHKYVLLLKFFIVDTPTTNQPDQLAKTF